MGRGLIGHTVIVVGAFSFLAVRSAFPACTPQVFSCTDVGPFQTDVALEPGVPAGPGELAQVRRSQPPKFARTDLMGSVVTPPGLVALPGSEACIDKVLPVANGFVLASGQAAMRIDRDGNVLVPCTALAGAPAAGTNDIVMRGDVIAAVWTEPGSLPGTERIHLSTWDALTFAPRSGKVIVRDDVDTSHNCSQNPHGDARIGRSAAVATTGSTVAVSWREKQLPFGSGLTLRTFDLDGVALAAEQRSDTLVPWECVYSHTMAASTAAYGVAYDGQTFWNPANNELIHTQRQSVHDELGAFRFGSGRSSWDPNLYVQGTDGGFFFFSSPSDDGLMVSNSVTEEDQAWCGGLDLGGAIAVTWAMVSSIAYASGWSRELRVYDCSGSLPGAFPFTKGPGGAVQVWCPGRPGTTFLLSRATRKNLADRQALGTYSNCPVVDRPPDRPGLTLYRVGI